MSKKLLALFIAAILMTHSNQVFVKVNNNVQEENKTEISLISPKDEASIELSIFKDVVDSKNILDEVPTFNNMPYVEVNNNTPYFVNTTTKEEFEIYSKLDNLGRCGVAFANIGTNLMPTEARGSIGMVKPSGWQTTRYDDLIDGKYLYNRCHLIAYELSGENANTLNLITGTRYLNIQGMLPFENKVANYVKQTKNHVLYRVTPIFEGDNLVASGVLMEGYSVEDKGKGISYCVYCYNVQPGININYADGNSFVEEDSGTNTIIPELIITTPTPEVIELVEPKEYTYVLNINSGKFHYPSCSSVGQILDKNRVDYNGTREELINKGYSPCKRCNP